MHILAGDPRFKKRDNLMKYNVSFIASLSVLMINFCTGMDKPVQIAVTNTEVKDSVHSKGEGYKKSAIARLNRSNSENIIRCKEQKDVFELYKVLAKAKQDGRDKSPEFLNFNLIAVENGEIETGANHLQVAPPTPQKRLSLSPLVKKKIAESRLRKVAESISDEADLEDEEHEKKPTEKMRRNTISG